MADAGDGYLAGLSALNSNAQLLQQQTSQLQAIANEVGGVTVPATAFGGVPQSSQAATTMSNDVHNIAGQVAGASSAARTLSGGVTLCASAYQSGDTVVTNAYCGLISARTPIPTLSPAQ